MSCARGCFPQRRQRAFSLQPFSDLSPSLTASPAPTGGTSMEELMGTKYAFNVRLHYVSVQCSQSNQIWGRAVPPVFPTAAYMILTRVGLFQ